ncbi:hypothetical protein [Defluviimonas salinarum]|uniref:Uncharacterized protein n=1 Tax=Defluviimonas salinarum TaxID=2992147 RepID=A0ABT3J9D7_9RHOB|nr:hypothetical protein [Defluviimonas salinarum]MCW3784302.1 hypothetical protein [Defluviimonas salinarum]
MPSTDATPIRFGQEELLQIVLCTEPRTRSAYGLHGYPPMWVVVEAEGMALLARPARTQTRTPWGWEAADGATWGWHDGTKWVGQQSNGTFDYLERAVREMVCKGGRIVSLPEAKAPEADEPGF